LIKLWERRRRCIIYRSSLGKATIKAQKDTTSRSRQLDRKTRSIKIIIASVSVTGVQDVPSPALGSACAALRSRIELVQPMELREMRAYMPRLTHLRKLPTLTPHLSSSWLFDWFDWSQPWALVSSQRFGTTSHNCAN